MTNPRHPGSVILGLCSGAAAAALAIVFAVVASQLAQAQTYKVLHTFTGGADGGYPQAGLTLDKAGSLYGTAFNYGANSYGTVFQLKRKGSNWTFNPIYSFAGSSDGGWPFAGVIFGPNGTLYGTTRYYGDLGCDPQGCGTVFNLRPPASACKTALCPWKETVLYSFKNGADGGYPIGGNLVFDQAGSLYGTTQYGGSTQCNDGQSCGVVYELTPNGSGYTEGTLHIFLGNDGAYPENGVILDNAGNLYGTTVSGGLSNLGTVFQLSRSGSGWTENVLYSFQGGTDGYYPIAGLTSDSSGDLYGATSSGGAGGGGTVFKLTPSNGSWTYSLVYSFAGGYGCGAKATLVTDGAGNIYGTTACGGANMNGTVFRLTPSGNAWIYTSLHDFMGIDGASPISNVVFDANGNLYGTTAEGGTGPCYPAGCGVVWEITP